MKNVALSLSILLLTAGMASAATTVIDFESALSSYTGVTFTNIFEQAKGTAWDDAGSGSTVAKETLGAANATIAFAADVVFDGMYFTLNQSDGTGGTVFYEAYNDGAYLYTVTATGHLTKDNAVYFASGSTDLVDTVKIYIYQQDFVALDNVTYTTQDMPQPPVVPVPGSIALAGIGTCLASWIRKRKMMA